MKVQPALGGIKIDPLFWYCLHLQVPKQPRVMATPNFLLRISDRCSGKYVINLSALIGSD